MPSSATITTYYTFTANTKARSSQVNNNFGLYRGHNIPIEPLTATAADMLYDLGSAGYRWRDGYLGTVNLAGSTSTTAVTFKGLTAVTAGGAELLSGANTISAWSSTGLKRSSFEASTVVETAAVTYQTTTAADVSFLTLSITVAKSGVEFSLFGAPTGVQSFIKALATTITSVSVLAQIRLIRDTTTSLIDGVMGVTYGGVTSSSRSISVPSSAFRWYDNPGPGNYTYYVQFLANTSNQVAAQNVALRAREV